MRTDSANRTRTQTTRTAPQRAKTPIVPRPVPHLVVRPFQWLEPKAQPGEHLPTDVDRDLAYLQFICCDDDARIARALVDLSFRLASRSDGTVLRSGKQGVLNRRRRAARLWVNAILAGDISSQTLAHLAQTWVPQLAGTGPDRGAAAVRMGAAAVEFLRGAFSGCIFEAPHASLIRHARALHALETVLQAHLAAIHAAARPPVGSEAR